MRALLRQSALLLLSCLAMYALVLGLSYLWMAPSMSTAGMDTASASRSLFLTEPKYVFLGRTALASDHDKVLLLGASNVVAGFRQTQLQALLPGSEVDNIGVGGSNVTQLAQIVDLVHGVQTPEQRRHNTFVIGLWYGLFADDAVRWNTPDRHAGDTDIDIERYRYGFYRRGDQGPVEVLPDRWLEAGVRLIHPLLVIDNAARDMTATLRQRIAGKPAAFSDAQRDAMMVSDEERQRYLAFWADYMGNSKVLPDAQFQQLTTLVAHIAQAGGRVVLVDLPIPEWHSRQSPYYADYRARITQFFDQQHGQPRVAVAQLATGDADADFSDEVHPKPRVAQSWSRHLAAALNTLPASVQLVSTDTVPQN
jgi:hypothetical protein